IRYGRVFSLFCYTSFFPWPFWRAFCFLPENPSVFLNSSGIIGWAFCSTLCPLFFWPIWEVLFFEFGLKRPDEHLKIPGFFASQALSASCWFYASLCTAPPMHGLSGQPPMKSQ